MYRGSWLAKKIVNAVADDMTREWLHVTFDGEELGTTIEQAEKRFALKRKTNEALKWSRLYGGAVIIIGSTLYITWREAQVTSPDRDSPP